MVTHLQADNHQKNETIEVNNKVVSQCDQHNQILCNYFTQLLA